jgi:hypothetical protein
MRETNANRGHGSWQRRSRACRAAACACQEQPGDSGTGSEPLVVETARHSERAVILRVVRDA